AMIQHARALWGATWWLPALPWIAYTAALSAAGLVRWDHLAITALVAASAYGSERTRRFFLSAVPLLLVFLIYDSMRYWIRIGLAPDSVLTCELRSAELSLFGVRVAGELLTPNQLLGRLQHPALDLLCAGPYGFYLVVMCGHFLYLYFTDCDLARRFAWIALGTHLLGFATYRLLPAAPPWYVDLHGCTADLAAANDPAALTRVDALLGITYYRDLYSRGATVFGALPSLHVAYPLIGILATWRSAAARSRAIQVAYAAVMFFSAIYLNHHWTLDVLLGASYAVLAAVVVDRVGRVGRLSRAHGVLTLPRDPDRAAHPARTPASPAPAARP
ncbi:MAG TPA: phosphatase PAP2 family protein, partial [Candidatus Nanopelagicales bacterium]|nr:phosphatase PAP2 family protein [Candidatus Nanopelagicales bacterium]